jgi:dsDNA-binding SOS-regulon protein
LQYFPNDFKYGFICIFNNIEDQELKQEADQWYSDYVKLMEYSENTEYGKTKCFRCLLSPDREEAGMFFGINKVISRALDTGGVSIYPCRILNRFACPYDKKITKDIMDDGIQKKPNVDYLFHLSELAFAVELALARAQEEDSVFRIKSAQDVYHVLTDKETLEKVLQQGLKDEHKQYKDEIVEFLLNMKNRTNVNDLTLYPC